MYFMSSLAPLVGVSRLQLQQERKSLRMKRDVGMAYVSCLYVTFPACVVYVLCAPCRALSMNLEPSTTESNYLHTLLRTTCLYARPHLRMRISSIFTITFILLCLLFGTPFLHLFSFLVIFLSCFCTMFSFTL